MATQRIRLLLIIITLAMPVLFASAPGCAASAQKRRRIRQSEPWRKSAPKPGLARAIRLPATREVRLENGLTLVFIEDHRAPIVTILAGIPLEIIPSKDINLLTDEVALAEATAELMTEGAGSRSSEQLARDVETLGGRLSSSANDDYAEVSMTVVAENAERMIDLLGDVLMRANFPENEVELYKRNRIQNLVVQRQDPAFLAGEQFDRAVFGSHPYAISSPTSGSIEVLDRTKIQQFYRSRFLPGDSVLVIAGDFATAKMEEKVRGVFAGWKETGKTGKSAASPEFPRRARRQVYLIDRPGSEQADFRVGGLAVKRSDPDYFPLLVANSILGAGTSSRLFLGIRERKGYAYDVYSSLDPLRQAGTFFGGAQTRAEVAALAIKDMLAEFDRLRTTKAGPHELQSAKNYLNGLFSLALSTQGGVAHRTLQTYMLDLGRGYLEAYRARIESVTAAEVQRVARKYLPTDSAAVVVVGEASKLKKPLEAIGPVEVLDLEGKSAKRPAP